MTAQQRGSTSSLFFSETDILEQFRTRIIKQFLDIIILKEAQKNTELSGYDVILLVNRKFRFLLSAGNAYSVLYGLERQNLIEGTMKDRKRVYRLTRKGEQWLKTLEDSSQFRHLASLLV